MSSLTEAIRARAHESGFDLVGITAARPAPLAAQLSRWIADGMHGEMRYMEDAHGRRGDPRKYLPWARSLVVVALSYFTPHALSTDPRRGAISRYAWGRDYHREVRARLETLCSSMRVLAPACSTHAFVDTSPVLEKGVAEAAGVGWRGKHTNLLRKRYGGWFFLGGVATDLELEPDPPARDHCGTCTSCITACPTGAIVAPYVLDARLCISYLTIELRGPIPRTLRPLVGNRIFGCDDCQDVCPWNRFARVTPIEAFAPRDGNLNPWLIDLMRLTRSEWNRRFKKTAVRRAHYEGFLRNVAVALGNWGAPQAEPVLLERLHDAHALVRGHAAWALGRIGSTTARAALQKRRGCEDDAWVREEIDAALNDDGAAALHGNATAQRGASASAMPPPAPARRPAAPLGTAASKHKRGEAHV